MHSYAPAVIEVSWSPQPCPCCRTPCYAPVQWSGHACLQGEQQLRGCTHDFSNGVALREETRHAAPTQRVPVLKHRAHACPSTVHRLMVVQDTEERRRKLAAAATAISPEVQALIDQSMSVGDSDDEDAPDPGRQAGADGQALVADPPSPRDAAASQHARRPQSQDLPGQLQELVAGVEEMGKREAWAQDEGTSELRQLHHDSEMQAGTALQVHAHDSREPVIEPRSLEALEDEGDDDDDDKPEASTVQLLL